MCWKPKMSTPQVNTAAIPDPVPLKEEPKGIEFGGDDKEKDTQEQPTSGRKSLKIKRTPMVRASHRFNGGR